MRVKRYHIISTPPKSEELSKEIKVDSEGKVWGVHWVCSCCQSREEISLDSCPICATPY